MKSLLVKPKPVVADASPTLKSEKAKDQIQTPSPKNAQSLSEKAVSAERPRDSAPLLGSLADPQV
jgi:hypothetical protein